MWHKVYFLVEFIRFEFSIFLFQDWLANQGEGNQSTILFNHSKGENNWIYTFYKGISAMWNAVDLVQDLNSCRRVHFRWRQQSHHGHCLCACMCVCARAHVCVCVRETVYLPLSLSLHPAVLTVRVRSMY